MVKGGGYHGRKILVIIGSMNLPRNYFCWVDIFIFLELHLFWINTHKLLIIDIRISFGLGRNEIVLCILYEGQISIAQLVVL